MVHSVITCDEIIEVTKTTPKKSVSIKTITTTTMTVKTDSTKPVPMKSYQNLFE